ncbi:IS3 family transposase [Paenibacillus graminis]
MELNSILYYLYIRFYNHTRFQTKLSNLSPYEY